MAFVSTLSLNKYYFHVDTYPFTCLPIVKVNCDIMSWHHNTHKPLDADVSFDCRERWVSWFFFRSQWRLVRGWFARQGFFFVGSGKGSAVCKKIKSDLRAFQGDWIWRYRTANLEVSRIGNSKTERNFSIKITGSRTSTKLYGKYSLLVKLDFILWFVLCH